MIAVPPWRQIVVEQLELLASENEQLEYERNVPRVDITAEMISGWFDTSYHPADAHFCSCFSESELAALSAFSAALSDLHARLPGSNGTVASWLASSSWLLKLGH